MEYRQNKLTLKLIILLVVVNLFFITLLPIFSVKKASAQNVDPVAAGQRVEESVERKSNRILDALSATKDFLLNRVGKVLIKNTLKTFVNKMAYEAATQIAEGNVGQSPMFTWKGMGDLVIDAAETAGVNILDDLTREFTGFGICDVPSDIKYTIHFSLFKEYLGEIEEPKCTLDDINKNWTQWAENMRNAYSSEEYLRTIARSFKPSESQVGAYLELEGILTSKMAQEAGLAQVTEQVNQGMSAVTEPVSGFIKTPAATVLAIANTPVTNALLSESTFVGDIVADGLSVFTNTLASKLLKKYLVDGLLDTSQLNSQSPILTYLGLDSGYRQTARATQDQFADFVRAEAVQDTEPVLGYLSQCQDPDNPGPTDCVMTSALATAIDQKLTVKEAISRGYLRADWPLGFLKSGQMPGLNEGYSYRNLVIMRQHRIIPATWELAALYVKEYGGGYKTLQDIINCFEDSEHPDDNTYPEACRNEYGLNPYYHLIDPNWVLKAPQTLCAKQGVGYEIIYSDYACIEDNVPETVQLDSVGGIVEDSNHNPIIINGPVCDPDGYDNIDQEVLMVLRNSEYCADWQSCLQEDETGNCIGGYGYCTKEKSVWQFQGDSCQENYNTCETFTRAEDGVRFSYLRNTLEECDSNDAGCKWYSAAAEYDENNSLVWQDNYNNRIYLNNNTDACAADDAGCTKVSRMLPGVNTVLNGNFSLISADDEDRPIGWTYWQSNSLQDNNINFIQTVVNSSLVMSVPDFGGQSGTLYANTEAYIPIDSRYSYKFSYKVKSSSGDQRAKAVIKFYDESKQICHSSGNPDCYADWMVDFDGARYLGTEYPSTGWQTFEEEYTGNGFDGDRVLPAGVKYIKISLYGPQISNGQGSAGSVIFDDVQFSIVRSPVVAHNSLGREVSAENYQTDYSQDENLARQYLQVAPDYLGCEGYNNILFNITSTDSCVSSGYYWRSDINHCVASGSSLCDNYATYCEAADVGCQGYTPLNGDPEIPGIVTSGDLCPAECVGFDTYLEYNSYFEEVECPMATTESECAAKGCSWDTAASECQAEPDQPNFIPETAQVCQSVDAGCEQFTNLDEVAQGGEGIEYFSYLKQCISPNNSNIASYYTWEGSDTFGYQLKKWELLESNYNNGPCTNVILGSEECQDTATNRATCSEEEAANGNLNCRQFIDTDGNEYWLLQDKTITASEECHPYRRSATNQIYNADPSEGRTCSAVSNGCREYKGNTGNNVRNIIFDEFESGSTGNWQNTNGNSSGLEISNESVYQSGHSLRVNTFNKSAVYPLDSGEVSANKQYTLSLWAKKSTISNNNQSATSIKETINKLSGWFKVAKAQDSSANLEFNLNNITTDWDQYVIGPLEFDQVAEEVLLKITAEIGEDEEFFIDNVILKEVTSNFYVIKDSWQTPNSCDLTQLGCQEYADRSGNLNYLKSFEACSSSEVIGCEAYLNTNNTTYYQNYHSYTDICDINSTGTKIGDDCYIRGEYRCSLEGQETCNYVVTSVAGDNVEYLVNSSDSQCQASKQGCSLLGEPSFNQQLEDYNDENYITQFRDTYLVDNPDYYEFNANARHAVILCSESGMFCTEFTGDISGAKSYYDPADLEGETNHRTCYFSTIQNKWLVSGTDEVCSNSTNLPAVGQPTYDGWVGICPASESSCTEYRDPESTPITAESCDANISPTLTGVCENISGDYCLAEINGLEHKVCRGTTGAGADGDFNRLGCTQAGVGQTIYYSSQDWYCAPGQNTTDANRACCIGPAGDDWCDSYPNTGTGEDEFEPVEVCSVRPGQFNCNYDLLCDSYYYLSDTVETGSACQDGLIDREAGCLLFNDTSQSGSLTWNAGSTIDGQNPADCSSQSSFTTSDYCEANTYLSVIPDRQCAEWLQCGGAVKVDDGKGANNDYACLDLIKCRKADPNNPLECLDIVSEESTPTNNTVDASDVESIRNLTGFSHPGINWGNGQAIEGYFSVENMSQLGQKVAISNSGFESYSNNFVSEELNIDSWTNRSGSGQESSITNCRFYLDTDNPQAGRYSAIIWARGENDDDYNCFMTSGDDNLSLSDGLYTINSSKDYNVSFYARSKDGNQLAGVRLYWFNSDGTLLGNFTREFNPDTNWSKYIYSVLADEIPANATKLRIGLYVAKQAPEQIGKVWFDEVLMEPILQLSQTVYTGKDCRLYPEEDSPSCSYQADYQGQGIYTFQGINGYCLEPDPLYQQDINNPDNWQRCLQWYPVDSLSGDSVSASEIGYSDRSPLYYCLESLPQNLSAEYNVQLIDANDPTILNNFATPHFELSNNPSYFIHQISDQTVGSVNAPGNEVRYYDYEVNGQVAGYHESLIERMEVYITDYSDNEYFGFLNKVIYTKQNLDGDASSYENSACQNFGKTDDTGCWATNWHMNNAAGGAANRVTPYIIFNNDGYVERVGMQIRDGSGGGGVEGLVRLVFRPYCSVVAQVSTDSNENKVWLQRFESGWYIDSGDGENSLRLNQSNIYSPYGSINGIANNSDLISLAEPILVGHGTNGSGYFAGLPWSGQNNQNDSFCFYERDGWGTACSSNSDCGDGICLGVGKYCFNDEGFMTGQACTTEDDCDNGETCNSISSYQANRNDQITRLQRLFAEVYGVWQWNIGDEAYESCSPFGDNNCNLVGIDRDISDNVGQDPQINYITVTNTEIKAPGGLSVLQFASYVNLNQLPITDIRINWGDGTEPDSLTGERLNHKPNQDNPHSFYHFYTCVTNSQGNRCIACTDGSVPVDGVCTYDAPRVNIMDNWGLCANGTGDNCVDSLGVQTTNTNNIRIVPRD